MRNHNTGAQWALAFALALVAVTTPCRAQSDDELARLANLPLEELVNTRVTSVSGRPGSRFTTPAAVTVITADDIRRNGHRSVVAGLIVGYGTSLGGGCTSGHGVCGIGRLSKRSIVATIVFVATAMATVYVVRHVVPGGVA